MVRPLIQLGSGFSIQFDFGPDENTWFKEMTAKHRYYARKALQTKNLSWRYGDEYELMETLADLGKRMQDKKKIPAGNYTLNELTQMQKSLSGSLRVLIGYLGDNPISACLTMRSGSEAIYVNAATIGPGRDIGAAYAMFVMLRRHLKNENIDKFDFGGIAPCTALASGVDHFKLGFGGRVIEYLGEWEAGGWMTRAAGNAAVFLSQQRQRIRS
jgi:lipid II:glycine glycyltransferase (peptidoglycan interpeptide bridge formation enzyme)